MNKISSKKNEYFFKNIFQNGFFKCPKCMWCHDCSIPEQELLKRMKISLNTTPSISPFWNYERIFNCFTSIGAEIENPFIPNSNHFGGCLIKPIGLLMASNGLHSTTVGILDNNAFIYPECFVDITPLLTKYHFDGFYFRHSECNTIVHVPDCTDIGIIFEVGRILIEHNLTIPFHNYN